MNETSQFHFAQLKRLRAPGPEEFEFFIELMPYACLLVDERSGRILTANTRTAELTLFTKSELAGLDTFTLWMINPENDAPIAPSTMAGNAFEPVEHNGFLIRRDLNRLPVRILAILVPGKDPRNLIILNTNAAHTGQDNPVATKEFLAGLNRLFEASLADEENSAIEQVLQAAGHLSGADLLVVYRLTPDQPLLQRQAAFGRFDLLPEQLTAQDLSYLLKPRLWAGSKRPGCNLHRVALNSRLFYLASAPIGQPHALIGLLVIASSSQPPTEVTSQVAQLAATNLAVIIQQVAQKTAYQARLDQLASRLQAGTTLLERMSEGVLILDAALKVRHSNPAVETILGYTQREMAEQPAAKILIGTEASNRALEAARQGNVTYNLGNERLYRRNGQSFLALIRIFPMLNREQVEGVLVIIQDLSEKEQIQAQSQHLEGQAILGEIIAVFAHEIRNPINNISTGLQLMAYNLGERDAGQESIQRMLQDCDRLEELIKSVLAFSRPMEYEMEILDLGTLLSRQLERMRLRIQNLNIHCDLQIDPDCPRIWGNLHALEQVFNNLISNALQAMNESGGSLIVRVALARTVEGRSFAEVSITDTGPGIPSEHQERIFQPFFTTKRTGTGLGLPIAKRIVTAHKGAIRLTSFPGGTVFQIQFPAASS